MPSKPHQFRLYASRFNALAKNARSPEARHNSSPRWPKPGIDWPPKHNQLIYRCPHGLRWSLADPTNCLTT